MCISYIKVFSLMLEKKNTVEGQNPHSYANDSEKRHNVLILHTINEATKNSINNFNNKLQSHRFVFA